MFIKRILILVFLVLVILGCSKTVNSKDITYNAEKDLIVLKSNEEKAFTGTVENYNEKGILQFKLNLKKGKTLPNNLTFKKQEVFSENYLNFTTVDEMLTDTTLVYSKDLNIPFTGKIEYPREDNDAQVLITYKDGKKTWRVCIIL